MSSAQPKSSDAASLRDAWIAKARRLLSIPGASSDDAELLTILYDFACYDGQLLGIRQMSDGMRDAMAKVRGSSIQVEEHQPEHIVLSGDDSEPPDPPLHVETSRTPEVFP